MKVSQQIHLLIHQGSKAITRVKTFVAPVTDIFTQIYILFLPAIQTLILLRGLFILLLCLVLSSAFTLFKNTEEVYYPYFCNQYIPFCLSRIELTRDTYWYFLIEHLYNFLLALYIYFDPPRFKRALLIFASIHFVDTFDYVLAYGQTWFYLGPFYIDDEKIGPYPISWNVLKTVVFAIAIFGEVLMLIEQRWNKRYLD